MSGLFLLHNFLIFLQLLSEREQLLLAEEEAALAAGSNKKNSDCVLM